MACTYSHIDLEKKTLTPFLRLLDILVYESLENSTYIKMQSLDLKQLVVKLVVLG